MSETYRVILPRIIFVACFVLIILGFYINNPTLASIASNLKGWGTTLATVAIFLGLINVARVQYGKISKQDEGYLFNIWTLAVLIIVIVIGQTWGMNSSQYNFIFRNWYGPLYARIYGLIACYSFSAAYRGFKMRSLESGFMGLAFILVLLKDAPVSTLIWPGFQDVGNWVTGVPLAAGMRSIFIGGTIAIFILALRIILGRERAIIGEAGGNGGGG
jgi:hypothetical protein